MPTTWFFGNPVTRCSAHTGVNGYADIKGANVVIVTAGVPPAVLARNRHAR